MAHPVPQLRIAQTTLATNPPCINRLSADKAAMSNAIKSKPTQKESNKAFKKKSAVSSGAKNVVRLRIGFHPYGIVSLVNTGIPFGNVAPTQ
jgi:hypothetical protein